APHKLVTRRVLAGLSTDELAAKARLWGGTVVGFEEGGFSPYVDSLKGGPSPATRVARALGCTVEAVQETTADTVPGDLADAIERLSTENRQLRQQNEELHRTITRIKEAVTA